MIRYLVCLAMLLSVHNTAAWTLDKEYQVFDSQPIDLRQQIGKKPVYIKLWATWCLDCRRELSGLQKTYEKYKDKMSIYAVNLNINETDEFISKLQKDNNLTIPIVMDNNGSIASNFQFYGTPFHALINADGKLVYTSYKDDENLAKALKQLSKSKNPETTVTINKNKPVKTDTKGVSLLYFSATWCDWYMKDIHPEMSENCIKATNMMNQLQQKKSALPLKSYVTHLWTETSDLKKYLDTYSIQYSVEIDQDNLHAQAYAVSQYPTLLLLKDGKEIKRFDDFSKAHSILDETLKFLQP
jgi:thiol-disulfide isomerase/thioredoxin